MDRTISPAEASVLLGSGEALLIDVREPDEFREAHIPWAVSVPLARVGGLLRDPALPPGRTIIFQCQKGGRGEQACGIARGADPQRSVGNLAGGIEAWVAAGLPVIGAMPHRRVSLFRQVQMIIGALVLASVAIGIAGVGSAFYLAALLGLMLAWAGVTGWCGLAMLLARMPWNRPAG